MHRKEADAQRDRLQQEDPGHTYVVSEQPAGGWAVVRIGLPRRAENVTGERGKPASIPDDPRPSLMRQIPPYGPAA